MSQSIQLQLQSTVDSTLQSLSTRVIRPLQKKSYLCSASCFDSSDTSAQSLDSCVQRCQMINQVCSQVVQGELGEMQSRIQREMVSCEDKVRDKGVTDQGKAQKMYEECGDGILKGWVGRVPKIGERIEKRIKEEAKKL
ncbi:hypothetical protein TrVE_jg7898 [Triparma verrucosa]|uniref:Uncharacterized protein n=1 Tax=Triparma verrucosa TaxID=1606542 RepID=A0A9W7F5M6_9STRA|nr:hypothetical protein TrVE_jg7898 [Triparma verrucosa]